MSAITPSTNLKLLKVPIEIDEKNQITFGNLENQYNYFNSLPKLEAEKFSYQRKDSVIRYPAHIDTIMEYNYVMYQNENYNDKWFYAFITDMQYISNGMTAITIKTDVYQTWFNDLTYKACFVEREHVNDDTVGLHTIPEGLETGEYINQSVSSTEANSLNFLHVTGEQANYVVLAVTDTALNVAQPVTDYNGIFGGLTFLVFPSFADCRGYISYAQTQVSEDNIYSAFMVPYKLGTQGSSFEWFTHSGGFHYGFIQPVSLPVELSNPQISKPTVLDSNYTPRNKKLLTSPYVYFTINNNAGAVATYKYEYFTNINGQSINNCNFSMLGSIGVGCSIKLYPLHYKMGKTALNTNQENYVESIDAGKLPTCSWTNDSYINWLTSNAVNIPLNIVGDIGRIAIGTGLIASGVGAVAGVGAVGSGIGGIGGTLKQMYEHSLVPATGKGGVTQGELNFANNISYTLQKMSIKEEYAKIIDQYFDMFGYKVNTVKVPNLTGRINWNYVKTIDCNIVADIPQKDLQEIKDMFNKGVTLWHNPSTFLNYNVSNTIIS